MEKKTYICSKGHIRKDSIWQWFNANDKCGEIISYDRTNLYRGKPSTIKCQCKLKEYNKEN